MIQRLFLAILFVGAASTYPALGKKTIEQHWEEVGLVFSYVEPKLATSKCYESERYFLACFHAINTMLAAEKDPVTLVPATRLAVEKGFGPVAKDFKTVKAVSPKKMESEDLAEVYDFAKAEKKLRNDAITALFKEKASQPVNFEELVAWAKTGASFGARESVITGAVLNALLEIMEDPHTSILPLSLAQEQAMPGSSDFTGVGAVLKVLTKNGKKLLVVVQPLEGGPAFKSGVRANDVITHVDGTLTEEMDFTEAVEKIKGPKGTDVKLSLLRGTVALELTITRDLIEQKNVEFKMIGASSNIGYVKLGDFMERDDLGRTLVYEGMKNAITELKKNNPEGFIIDLRDNGGGLLTESIRVASLFLKKNSLVVSTKDLTADPKDPKKGTWSFSTADQPLTDLPVVVLVNPRSASASEIVAGAWQDHQRAFVVGERTFGKGTVQGQGLMAGVALVMRRTIQRFYRPSGLTNQIEGILPDVEVYSNPTPTKADKMAFREEDEYTALPPVGKKWVQPRPGTITKLTDCLKKGGAEAAFDAAKTDAIPPDFQRLVAQDAIHCISTLGLWSAEMETPEWKAPDELSPLELSTRNLIFQILRLFPGVP